MGTITPSKLNQKIKLLPANLLQEVNDYIEFLAFKSSHTDWADQLTEKQISLIEKGKKDIKENKVVSHKEAKERIKNYIKNKSL
ncbi:MAG: DUF2281 domain-containing protein [Flavobacterium sp.]